MKRRLISTIVILIMWQIVAMFLAQPILLPYPIAVFKIMISQITDSNFYLTILLTLNRVVISVIVAGALALILGFISGLNSKAEDYLSALINIIKAVPNVCYMVLILLWFGSEISVSIITFFIIFPNIYSNVVLGIKSLPFDQKLINLVYPAPLKDLILYVYWPEVWPYYLASLKTAMSLGLKVSVMAEIIGAVSNGIGKRLSYAKTYLETDEILAWTIWIILISSLIDIVFTLVTNKRKEAN